MSNGSAYLTVKDKLKRDDSWKRFKRIVATSWDETFDKYMDEIQNMHKARPIRLIGVNNAHPSGKKLAKAQMVDQAYRSRCIEISMNILRNRNNLEQAINAIKKHVESRYHKDMAQFGIRGVTERKRFVDSLVSFATKKLGDINSIVQMSDLVVGDIDQGTWAIKHTVDALQIATKREYGI